jgi:hypothetical protein
MRPIERIDNFLFKVDWGILQKKWDTNVTLPSTKEIKAMWMQSPDQRIGQLLINNNIIPDSFPIWKEEEEDILIEQGFAPEEVVYWTSVYDENERLLKKPVSRLIKDLDKNHIQAIKAYASRRRLYLSEKVKIAFENVLNKQ